MTSFSEERLADLIGALPPAPPAWVQAAIELPAAREAIDQLVARAQADAAARATILADLEQAVRDAGVDPSRPVLDGLRARLSQLEP